MKDVKRYNVVDGCGYACHLVEDADGKFVNASDYETLRAELAELRGSEPVAYMHNKRADVIHTSVKSLLSDFAVNYGPESMLRPIDKSEHYTIPLYAAPVPAQPAADVAAIAKAVRDIPSRIESLGGQRFAYVKLSEVIDTIYSMAGKQPAVPEAVRKLIEQLLSDYESATEEEYSGTSYYEPRMRFSQEARAFLAKIDAAEVDESEFQVISGNEEDACIEAATSGPRDVALREAMRYAHQYAEDGPVKVVELVTVAMLPAARRQESE